MARHRIEARNITMPDGRPVSWEINDSGTDGVEVEIFASDKQGITLRLFPSDAEEFAMDLLKAAAANRITYREEQEEAADEPPTN